MSAPYASIFQPCWLLVVGFLPSHMSCVTWAVNMTSQSTLAYPFSPLQNSTPSSNQAHTSWDSSTCYKMLQTPPVQILPSASDRAKAQGIQKRKKQKNLREAGAHSGPSTLAQAIKVWEADFVTRRHFPPSKIMVRKEGTGFWLFPGASRAVWPQDAAERQQEGANRRSRMLNETYKGSRDAAKS